MEKLKQNELAHVQSQFTIDKKEMSEGEFEAVLSTDSLDRHGEKVSIKGMVIPKRTIRMYFNHIKYGEMLPIGVWTRIWKTKDGVLMGRGKIDLVDDFERKIAAKIKSGTIDSISIGFVPKEWDTTTDTWTKSELSEASVVNEPANPEAVITQKSEAEELDKSFKEKLEKTEESEEYNEDERDEVMKSALEAIEKLKSKVGALEDAAKAANDGQSMKELIKVRLAGKEVDKSAESINTILKIKLKEIQ